MLCKKFRDLTPVEKVQFIGELNHAVMNSDILFEAAQVLISAAKERGILERVIINPVNIKEDASE